MNTTYTVVVAPPPPVGEDWCRWDDGDAIPAYDRVDIIRVAAGIKGATLAQVDNVATVSQYWGPGSFVRKWRPAAAPVKAADPNAKMISRDGSAPARSWSDTGAQLIVAFDSNDGRPSGEVPTEVDWRGQWAAVMNAVGVTDARTPFLIGAPIWSLQGDVDGWSAEAPIEEHALTCAPMAYRLGLGFAH